MGQVALRLVGASLLPCQTAHRCSEEPLPSPAAASLRAVATTSRCNGLERRAVGPWAAPGNSLLCAVAASISTLLQELGCS